MDDSFDDATSRAEQYSKKYGLELIQQIGFGNDGVVFATDKESVVKALMRRDTYQRERDAYCRLFDNNIHHIAGCAIAELLNYHNGLQVIEIEQLTPPFVIDFGKAYLDKPPDFSPEVLAEWELGWKEHYPEDDWPRVQQVLNILQAYGIFYFDPQPGNIKLYR
jgi:hypothetical protein